MKILHFSDVHAGAPPENWRVLLDKRWIGAVNYYLRRRLSYDIKMISSLVERVLSENPDIVVCSGDLTSTSQPSEFAIVREALSPLVESGVPLIYVPGNHDYYVHDRACLTALTETFEYLNSAFQIRFEELPATRRFKECEFILVNESCPTSIFSSCGHMSTDTAKFIGDACRDESVKRPPRILVGHFPVEERFSFLRLRHRMWGQKVVAKLLSENRIDLSLCGHVHMPFAHVDDTGRGEVSPGSVTKYKCLAKIEYLPADDTFEHEKVPLPEP